MASDATGIEPNQNNKSPDVEWKRMPYIALERIYSFLERKDRVNLSLVCADWKSGYESPSVWKTFTFNLKPWHLLEATCSVLEHAVEKYNHMFKHVEIKYDTFKCGLSGGVWCKRFMELLEILKRKSELISIEFENLSFPLGKTGEPTYNNLCRVIVDFLESQHKLQRAEFSGCFFKFPEGVEILRKLIEKNSRTLKHLGLRGFVRYRRNDHQKTNFEPNLLMLSDLPNLITLDSDYSLIFVNMVTQAVKNLKTPALSKIILGYNDTIIQDMYGIIGSKGFRGLRSTDWQFLREKSPELQVDLTFEFYSMSEKVVEFFIGPNMPISRLEYGYLNRSVELDLERIL